MQAPLFHSNALGCSTCFLKFSVNSRFRTRLRARSGAHFSTAPWLKRHSVRDRELVADLPQKLHLGEREAIVLAMELNAELLIDDREARKAATARGVECFGTLRVLKRAKDMGLVNRVKPALDDLLLSGTYMSKSLYEEVLRLVDEA